MIFFSVNVTKMLDHLNTMKMEMSARPRQRAGKRGIRTGSPG